MPEWVFQLGGYMLGLGSLYGAIRADLKHAIQTGETAHKRIDDHIGDHLTGKIVTDYRRHG